MFLLVIDGVVLYGMCSVFVCLANGLLRVVVWRVLFVCVSCFGVCVAQSCLCLVCVLSDVVWFVVLVVCVRLCVLVSCVFCCTCVVCDLLCGNA